jgi:fatty acid desaturase
VNVRYIAQEWAAIIAVLAGAFWARVEWKADGLSTTAYASIAVVVVTLIGVLQHRLSGLGHEASHFSLFRNKLLNDLVSDIFCMIPTFALTRQFRATHLDHHRFVNDPIRDPDAKRLRNAVPGMFPMSRGRFLTRYVDGSLWLPDLVKYIFGQGHNAGVFAKGHKPMRHAYPLWVAVLLLVGVWAAVIAVGVAVHAVAALILFWLLPLVTSYAFFMRLREIAHHSNAPDDGSFTNSRVFHVHPVVRYAVFPYGQDYHLTHHLFGILPHYNMAEAHAILMRNPTYRRHAVVCRGYFLRTPGSTAPTVLDVLSKSPPGPGVDGEPNPTQMVLRKKVGMA